MNLTVTELLSLLALPVLLGAGVLRACGVRWASDRLAYPGWCWVCGATGTGLVTFAWLWTGAPVDRVLPLQLAIGALAILLYAVGRSRVGPATAPLWDAFPFWERSLFVFATAAFLAVTGERVLIGNLAPLCQGDDAGFWALKAKVIFSSGGFNQAFAHAMAIPESVYHKDYPLLSPLLHVWTFANAGEITQVANRVPTQMFAFALVLILAAALRRVARPAIAAGLLLCVASLPETAHGSRSAYVDLTAGVGVLTTFDAWQRWRDGARELAWWRLTCLGLTCLLWSKHEGFLYLVAMLTAGFVCRVLARRGGAGDASFPSAGKSMWLLPAMIVVLTWSFNAWFGFSNYLAVGNAREHGFFGLLATQFTSHVPVILGYFARDILFEPTHANLLPLALVVLSATIPVSIWRSSLRLPTLALVFAFLSYVVVFTATPADVTWHLSTAAARVSYQLVPAMALWLASAATLLTPSLGARRPAGSVRGSPRVVAAAGAGGPSTRSPTCV